MAQILPGIATDLTCQSQTDLESTFSLVMADPQRGLEVSSYRICLNYWQEIDKRRKARELIKIPGWDIKYYSKRDFNMPQ